MVVQWHTGNWVSTTFGNLIQGLALLHASGHLLFFFFFRPPIAHEAGPFTHGGSAIMAMFPRT